MDLFAGPGGLGEGFASYRRASGLPVFDVRLSIEKDESACRTLWLRAFYRQFPQDEVPSDYYWYLRHPELSERAREQHLRDRFPGETKAADREVLRAELGRIDPRQVRKAVGTALSGAENWVLLGGPPCQAYSVVGRSRNKGNPLYVPSRDERHTLYVEYLQVLADHAPAVFVFENVKGLLSATLDNQRLFQSLCSDLTNPHHALKRIGRAATGPASLRYTLLPLSASDSAGATPDLADFVVRMEDHGIPQSRHRLIIVGIREDLAAAPLSRLPRTRLVPSGKVLLGLPPLRSGLSRESDAPAQWLSRLHEVLGKPWLNGGCSRNLRDVILHIKEILPAIAPPPSDRGGEFLATTPSVGAYERWYLDPRLEGVCNHSSRAHMASDLHRYLFAACFARIRGRSPDLRDFPKELWPKHANVKRAVREGHFDDRFRVQLDQRVATTVTSHLAKDGHYFIHPDPMQCRSLTVREAARLQGFPDNYLFCGPRTRQYIQVGNAVPPLLAVQIARIIDARLHGCEMVRQSSSDRNE